VLEAVNTSLKDQISKTAKPRSEKTGRPSRGSSGVPIQDGDARERAPAP